jgi:hypothetical protein
MELLFSRSAALRAAALVGVKPPYHPAAGAERAEDKGVHHPSQWFLLISSDYSVVFSCITISQSMGPYCGQQVTAAVNSSPSIALCQIKAGGIGGHDSDDSTCCGLWVDSRNFMLPSTISEQMLPQPDVQPSCLSIYGNLLMVA